MSQPPALRRESRQTCSTRSWVLALVCCVLAGALYAQEVPPVAGPAPAAGQPPAAAQPAGGAQPPAAVQPLATGQPPVAGQPGSFWTAEQQKTYNEVKAILDRGEVPISPQRRALDDVCDQLATKLADPTQPGNWAAIRDLLIGVNTYAVSPVMKHALVANAPEQVRLEGIIVLVSVKEAVQPKDGIVKALKDPSPAVRWWAIHGVVDKQYGDAGEAVATLVLDENPEVSLTAAKAVATLKVPKAEGCLVSMVARELARRAPLVQQLADLETQRKALQDKVGRTSDEDQQVTALGQRIDEASGRISFSTLVIYRVGEALSALTNKADGSELTRAMSDADLQKVIDRLQTKYPPPAAR